MYQVSSLQGYYNDILYLQQISQVLINFPDKESVYNHVKSESKIFVLRATSERGVHLLADEVRRLLQVPDILLSIRGLIHVFRQKSLSQHLFSKFLGFRTGKSFFNI